MPYADLHVHTTRSDGQLELEAVPAAARDAGVDVVALTDHDRLQPFDDPVIEREGVTIVHGIELRVELTDETSEIDPGGDGAQRVDLLGYGVEPTADLAALVEGIQENRRERGQAIVDCVEDRLGVDLDVTVDEGFGRPHVARAIAAHPDVEYDYRDAFDGLIGDGDPCFVAREIPSFDRGRRVLADACAIVSLAHPLRYGDPERALARAGDLDAVELPYPYDRDVGLEPVERTIQREGLLVTGGSDAHGDELGLAGLTADEYHRLGLEER
ncbi:PHP domain-containing protein [Halosolutus amylolyticus]|uniref:PHP domain-containing protein n=1 Tax=Halosolutus amylolyticus TaxID=2932267 RepID=A0ABD5PK24_9EURY|nr:PHP domain-containing protein [Halosolutus amylolyticus]